MMFVWPLKKWTSDWSNRSSIILLSLHVRSRIHLMDTMSTLSLFSYFCTPLGIAVAAHDFPSKLSFIQFFLFNSNKQKSIQIFDWFNCSVSVFLFAMYIAHAFFCSFLGENIYTDLSRFRSRSVKWILDSIRIDKCKQQQSNQKNSSMKNNKIEESDSNDDGDDELKKNIHLKKLLVCLHKDLWI